MCKSSSARNGTTIIFFVSKKKIHSLVMVNYDRPMLLMFSSCFIRIITTATTYWSQNWLIQTRHKANINDWAGRGATTTITIMFRSKQYYIIIIIMAPRVPSADYIAIEFACLQSRYTRITSRNGNEKESERFRTNTLCTVCHAWHGRVMTSSTTGDLFRQPLMISNGGRKSLAYLFLAHWVELD